jgi:aminoglycoside phosphotransferase (APT) family kinase protein
MNNLVLRVAFSDDVHWIARVHRVAVDPSHALEHAMDMLSKIATMKTLNSRTTIPVPQVFAFDVSPSNELGFPYILMECLRGQALETAVAS